MPLFNHSPESWINSGTFQPEIHFENQHSKQQKIYGNPLAMYCFTEYINTLLGFAEVYTTKVDNAVIKKLVSKMLKMIENEYKAAGQKYCLQEIKNSFLGKQSGL